MFNFINLVRSLRGLPPEPTPYQRGYDYAHAELHPPYCGPDLGYEQELVDRLRAMADGMFNTTRREAEFDRGVRAAIADYEREHGAP